MYVLPQEIEVWYVIPAIRKELARSLVDNHEFSYEKAGALLGISKAAVSQYLSNKRANKIKFPPVVMKEIEKSADRIAKNSKKTLIEIQRLLGVIKQKKCSCDLCKKYNPEIMKYCKAEESCN